MISHKSKFDLAFSFGHHDSVWIDEVARILRARFEVYYYKREVLQTLTKQLEDETQIIYSSAPVLHFADHWWKGSKVCQSEWQFSKNTHYKKIILYDEKLSTQCKNGVFLNKAYSEAPVSLANRVSIEIL